MNKELTPRTLEIAEFYLTHPTYTYQALGNHFGITKGRISAILSSPRVTSKFPLLARRRVQSHLLPKALARYENIIEHSENDAVAEKASARVLASENVFDAPKLTITNELSTKTIEELRMLVGRAKDDVSPTVIEGEIVADTIQDTTQE